ncbi:SUMF1/EgtB/PvdO family nonheme iron enzyme [Desulfomicrobium baculatum]|uniref:Serine/threonine protein kinase n=1 Tax=Desulfomicrobium baculatum (strain DSM 4028 / VKM B-1378 / X) TaxID=525897 RepID=C7LRX1_DESBD|nr:SUMF1/EgtB/PvdO family nonheme iron enzyme [Desulfomicrobium baculatum]ACU89354.1 serine/threonine protein kinase [Desulfomicrobium baculatum DSM 4028]
MALFAVGSKIFKDYTCKFFVGSGIYGELYHVLSSSGAPYALKVYYDDVLLMNECVAVQDLSLCVNKHLVKIHDFDYTVDGYFCVLTEFIEKNFVSIVSDSPCDEGVAFDYFQQLMECLDVLDFYNIPHGHIKPSNIFIKDSLMIVGDYGTSRYCALYNNEYLSCLPEFGYMCPSSIGCRCGRWSDRWSVAVIFYKLLTGHFPFHAGSFVNNKLSDINIDYVLNKVTKKYREIFEHFFRFYSDIESHCKNEYDVKKIISAHSMRFNKEQCRNVKTIYEYDSQSNIILGRINPELGESIVEPILGMRFVWIPAGAFVMGGNDDPESCEFEEPVHQVVLSKGFWMGIYAVTQKQWKGLVASHPSFVQDDIRPVTNISWYDAQEFARTFTECSKGVKFALPTEAQWEYACRAGTITPYYWGDEAECWLANYGNGLTQECRNRNPGVSSPVGCYPPNPWKLYDMCGNVWEWCQDYAGRYGATIQIDPCLLQRSESAFQVPSRYSSLWFPERSVIHDPRICRGGCNFDYSNALRSSARGVASAQEGRINLGFRLVMTVDES